MFSIRTRHSSACTYYTTAIGEMGEYVSTQTPVAIGELIFTKKGNVDVTYNAPSISYIAGCSYFPSLCVAETRQCCLFYREYSHALSMDTCKDAT